MKITKMNVLGLGILPLAFSDIIIISVLNLGEPTFSACVCVWKGGGRGRGERRVLCLNEACMSGKMEQAGLNLLIMFYSQSHAMLN